LHAGKYSSKIGRGVTSKLFDPLKYLDKIVHNNKLPYKERGLQKIPLNFTYEQPILQEQENRTDAKSAQADQGMTLQLLSRYDFLHKFFSISISLQVIKDGTLYF
jgi:hypothetical protein